MFSAYSELQSIYAQLYRLGHVESILAWDRSAMMPPGGSRARTAAEAEFRRLIHGLRRQPRLAGLISQAEDEPLDALQRANLREIRRDWLEASALPESLIAASAQATAQCEHAWRDQRPANDWPGFMENFGEVLRLAREEALRLSDRTGLAPYDALIERYEPGMRMDVLDRMFDGLQGWLPDMVTAAMAMQERAPAIAPAGPFPLAAQRELCRALAGTLGFDFNAGRLDESAHPFTGGVPEDVRITVRYREDDFLQALNGTLHECGHGRYAQGLPREWLEQPLGRPRSFAIHESQSLFVEMQIGRSRAFAGVLAPMLGAHFGDRAGFDVDNLYRLMTRVAPGPIRVAADELSYPAHIILRYEIERDLIGGEIEAGDIPALWDEKMMRLLGVDTRGDFRDGCMQDIHWAKGAFGYFPSYALGAMYAAQWFVSLRRDLEGPEECIANGRLKPIFDWLQAQIWSQASRWETLELVRRVSGNELDPSHLKAHLGARYLGWGGH
ncbi:carboxypeptidase M32 [Azoarcus sp. L1K30]|uniref:carboxypeptidase M32 n=1 Tax=Azoarcus sp. L1K30 TaxID=2820277 RepID=UPI001B82A7C3|nr:carboxypeptidase M32 [Azoarcus sp. L1K30]MBR0565511.1 carboxypeptidase M32 [Azoarcus sp. L1K30]